MKFEYSPAVDLNDPLLKRLGRYPRVPDFTRDTLRLLGTNLAIQILKLQFKIEVHGQLAKAKRLAIVANHQSHLDTLTLFAALPWRLRNNLAVLAAEDYFYKRIGRAIAATILCQAVAFDRLHKSALKQWLNHLKDIPEGVVLFYPSGSRKSKEIQIGLLKLFLQSGWTIQPVHLEGTDQAWPSDANFWKPFGKLKVTFLEPHEGDNLHELIERLQKEWGKSEVIENLQVEES